MRSDRERWDNRYREEREGFPEPDPFLVSHRNLLTSGRAVDVACGRGANSLYLAEAGYRVDALDISFSALSELQTRVSARSLDVTPIVADLDEYALKDSRYDLVAVFYFFSPVLMPRLVSSLKPSGLLIYATYNFRHVSVKPGFCEDYLVPRGGLSVFFPGMVILVDEPETGEQGNLSRLIARKRD